MVKWLDGFRAPPHYRKLSNVSWSEVGFNNDSDLGRILKIKSWSITRATPELDSRGRRLVNAWTETQKSADSDGQLSSRCFQHHILHQSMKMVLYTRYGSGWWFGTFFHILGIMIPTDSYFSEGLKPPTRYGFPLRGGWSYHIRHVWACHIRYLPKRYKMI